MNYVVKNVQIYQVVHKYCVPNKVQAILPRIEALKPPIAFAIEGFEQRKFWAKESQIVIGFNFVNHLSTL